MNDLKSKPNPFSFSHFCIWVIISLFFTSSLVPAGYADSSAAGVDNIEADSGGIFINTGEEGDDWGFGEEKNGVKERGREGKERRREMDSKDQGEQKEKSTKEKRRERQTQEERDEDKEKEDRKERRKERKTAEETREKDKKPRKEKRAERKTQEEAAEVEEDNRRKEGPRERAEGRKREMDREPPERRREAPRERRRAERGAERQESKRHREGPNERRRGERQTEHNDWKEGRESPREARRTENNAEHQEWRRKREAPKERRRTERRTEHDEHKRRREAPKEQRRQQDQDERNRRQRQREAPKEARRAERQGEHDRWKRNREAPREARRQERTTEHNDWKSKREAPKEARRQESGRETAEWKQKRETPKEARRQEGGREHQDWKDRRERRSEAPKQREQAGEVARKERQDAKDQARDDRKLGREEDKKAKEAAAKQDDGSKGGDKKESSSGGGGGGISYTDDDGNKVTVESTEDGKIKTVEHADGSVESVETKDDGTKIEKTTTAEGETTTVTTSQGEDGSTTVTTETPDGVKETVKTTDDWRKGEKTTEVTRETPNGYWQTDTEGKSTWITQEGTRTTTTTTTTDREGNLKMQETKSSDGRIWTRDGDGTVTETHRSVLDGDVTQRIYGSDGIVTEVVRDAEGNVTSSKTLTSERHTNEKGETVVRVYDDEGIMTDYKMNADGTLQYQHSAEQKGEDRGRDMYLKMKAELGLSKGWDELPQSDRNSFNAEIDRQAQVAERRAAEAQLQQELADLRKAQEARQAAEDKAHREWQAEQRRKLDIKLAEIERERQYHMAQYEKHMAEYARIRNQQAVDSQLASAEGAMNEYARSKGLDPGKATDIARLLSTDKEFEKLYDAREAAAQVQFDAYARTEAEQAFYDAKSVARQEYGKFSAQAHRELEAQFIDETMSRAVGKEAASWGRYVSIGAEMRHQNAEKIHSADFEARRAWRTVELIEEELKKTDLTDAQREVLNELYNREVGEWSGARGYQNSLKNIERVGYAADVAVLATGGLAGAGANTLGKGAVTTTTRVLTTPLGKAAANQLAARAPTALTTAGKTFLANAGETTLGKAVGNVASQQLVQNMAADAVVGGTVDVGVQLYTKGEVDWAQTARSTAGGTAMGGLMNTTMRATSATSRGVNNAFSGTPAPRSSGSASGAVGNVARTGAAADGPGAALSQSSSGGTSVGAKTEAGTLRQPNLNNQGGGTLVGGKTEPGTLRQPTVDSGPTPNTSGQRDLGFPENTPPSQMTPQQRQAYNDHQAHQQWQQGRPIVEPGDGVLPATPRETSAQALPPGERSANLTQDQINDLFRGGIGRQLTPEQTLLKADVIASGRAPDWATSANPDFRNAANQQFFGAKGSATSGSSNQSGAAGNQLQPPPGFSGNKTFGGETVGGAAASSGAQKLAPPPGLDGNKTFGGETLPGGSAVGSKTEPGALRAPQLPGARAGAGNAGTGGVPKSSTATNSNASGSSAGAVAEPVKKSGFFSSFFGNKTSTPATTNKAASNASSGQSSGSGASSSSNNRSTHSDPAAFPAGGVQKPVNNAPQQAPNAKAIDPSVDPTLKRHPIDEVNPKWRADAPAAEARLKQWEGMTPAERKAYVDDVIGFIDEAAKAGDKWASRYMQDYRAGKLDLTFEPQLAPQFHGLNSGNKMRLNPFDANGNLRPAHELGSVALHEGVHNGVGGKAGMNEARAHFAQYAALHRFMKANPGTQLSGTIKKQYDAFLAGLQGGNGGFGARTAVKTEFTDGFYGQNYQDNLKLIAKTSSWKGGNAQKVADDYQAAYGRLDPADRAAFDQMFNDLRSQGKHGDAVREAENMMARDQVQELARQKQEKLNELIREVEANVDADLARAQKNADIDAMMDAIENALNGN